MRFSCAFIFLYSLLFGSSALAKDKTEEFLDQLKQAIDARDARQEGEKRALHLQEDDSRDYTNDICIHCPKVAPLTKQLNNILERLADQESEEHPYLQEEVAQLEGMYYLTIDGAWSPGDKAQTCKRTELGSFLSNEEESHVPKEQILKLDESFMDIEKLRSLQYIPSGNDTRIYFLRAKKPHRDKIIRVIISPEEKAQVTYFRIENFQEDEIKIPSLGEEYLSEDIDEPPMLPNFSGSTSKDSQEGFQLDGDESVGFTLESHVGTNGVSNLENWDDEQKRQLGNYLSAKYGLQIDREDGIPKKVRILDVKGSYQISGEVRLEGEAVLDSSQQRAEIRLTGGKNNTYATVKVEGSKTTYHVPIRMSIAQTGWRIKGALEGKIEGGDQRDRLNLDMISSDGHVYKARLTNKNGETEGLLTHQREVNGGRLSFELGEDEQWVRYSKKF